MEKKKFVTDLSKVVNCVKWRLTDEQKDEVLTRMNFWAEQICSANNDDEITKVIEKALIFSRRHNSLVSSLSYKERNGLYYHYNANNKKEITTSVYGGKNSKNKMMEVKGFYGWKPHRLSSGLFFDSLFRIVIKELGIK